MAKKRVPQFYGLGHSIFQKPNRKPRLVIGRYGPPTLRQMIGDAFNLYVMERCVRARISNTADLNVAGSKLAGRPMPASEAWVWFLDEFLRDRPEFAADLYAELVAEARRRAFGKRTGERRAIAVERVKREAAEVREQYAAERKENGGETVLFDSSRWQRLRYQVLAESDGKCTLCGRSPREHGVVLEVDHIKPRSRFPSLTYTRSNLQVLCFDCNRGKRNHDTRDWRVINGGKTTTG